jgi:D-inositol-3-phosphate glycosyltransferase
VKRLGFYSTRTLAVKPLRIAMISVHSSPVGKLGIHDTGGMSVYIRELAGEMGNQGHRVDIYTRAAAGDSPGQSITLSPNVRLTALEFGAAANAPKSALYPYLDRFFLALDQFRTAEDIDYDLIHSHYWLSGLVGRLTQQAWRIPHITTFHTLGAIKRLVGAEESGLTARIAAERELVNDCETVLVTSTRERDNLLRCYEASPEKVRSVPCGVNLDLFRPMSTRIARRRIGATMDEALLLYVGRFAPEKRLERLIHAIGGLNHIPRLRLIVVGGDGNGHPKSMEMIEWCRSLQVADRVDFPGRVDQKELPSYYCAADMLVLPSAYESFGMVALEAMACGTPVVATRVGAMEEIIRKGVNGTLVDGFKSANLADAVTGLLSRKPRQTAEIKTIRRSVRRYDWTRVAAGVLNVYYDSLSAAAPVTQSGPAEGYTLDHSPGRPRTVCRGCGRRG